MPMGMSKLLRIVKHCSIVSRAVFSVLAASRALIENTDLSAKEIALKALKITSDICVFTNGHVTVEEV